MEMQYILSKLCYYDKRHPSYDPEIGERDIDCHCDNCFYGRHEMAVYILELHQSMVSIAEDIKIQNVNASDRFIYLKYPSLKNIQIILKQASE